MIAAIHGLNFRGNRVDNRRRPIRETSIIFAEMKNLRWNVAVLPVEV